MKDPVFSVIIPVRDGASTLPLVLRCLSAQTIAPGRFEVLVIDDGSRDGTAGFLSECRPPFPLTVLTHPVSRGRSESRNDGHRQSRGKILVFLDGDMLPVPGWLACYEEAFTAGIADVVAGPRYNLETPRATDLLAWLASLLGVPETELLRDRIDRQFELIHSKSQPGQYPAVSSRRLAADIPEVCDQYPSSVLCAYSFVTSNVAVRREMFERTTGFDPFVRRAQDIELGMRLWECGCRFTCIQGAGANAYHLYWPSEERLLSDFEKLLFFYRHPYSVMVGMFTKGPDDSVLELIRKSGPATFDEELLQKQAGGCFDFRYSAAQAVWYFSSLFHLDPAQAARRLDEAVERGLAVGWQAGSPRYDLEITANWLSSFQFNNRGQTGMPGSTRCIPEHVCAGRWEAIIPAEVAVDLPPALQWDVPAPCGQQDAASWGNWVPDHLNTYLDREQNMLRGVPLAPGPEGIRLAFDFRIKRPAHPETDRPLAGSWLTPACSASVAPALRSFLEQMGELARTDPEERVRRIHAWLCRSFSHRENCFTCEQIVEAGFGNEFQRAWLFAALCRLAWIPARERMGAVLDLEESRGGGLRCEQRGVARNPLARPWVEVYLPSQGWIPVDFIEQNQQWDELDHFGRYRAPAGRFDPFAGQGWVPASGNGQNARRARVPALFNMSVHIAEASPGDIPASAGARPSERSQG